MSVLIDADSPDPGSGASEVPGDAAEGRDESKGSEAPSSGQFDGSEGEFEWAEGRGHGDADIADIAKAKNLFVNSTLQIGGDFNAGAGDRDGVMLPIADVTGSVRGYQSRFVEPGSFERLLECVRGEQVVLLSGVGCGRRTAAECALLRAGHTPILQLPSDVPARSLVDAIKRACSNEENAGVVIESIDPETLAALAGFELRRLKSALPVGARVVLTAGFARVESSSVSIEAPIVMCTSPDLAEVIERAGADGKAISAALEALRLLDGQVGSPEAALSLLNAANDPSLSPAEIAEVFAGEATEESLHGWLLAGQSAEHLASLAAGAALDGSAIAEVDETAAELEKLLAGETEDVPGAPKTFGLANRGWPAGVLMVARRPLVTHFGSHETEVVEVCGPHTRERVLSYLWRCLGPDYRGPLARWLRELPVEGSEQVSLGAAVSAGILFALDPVAIEADLLEPWALDERLHCRACTGLALGVPAAIGAEPAAARALARTWGRSHDVRLRHVAVLAYGGLLGAWDPASAAPSHLWRIARETPSLRRSADISLASLVAAGESASRARATVLGVLCAQAALARPPRRVFELLPLIVRHLTAREAVARGSLRALLSEPERDSLSAFASLLAQALLSASGYESACAALGQLLEAIAESRVHEEAVFALIAETIAQAPQTERVDSLRARLRRPLLARARERGSIAEAAQMVLQRFFPTSNDARRNDGPTGRLLSDR